ncbi:MAG: guanylate kinase [Dongiaceae bacterium]
MQDIYRRGFMLVLSSPSGAGKTTISRALLDLDANLTLSISVTTRPKRPGETEGIDYHFTDVTKFNLMANRGEFLEHAKVFNNYYATPRQPVEKALSEGKDVLFDIDWQGTQQLAERAREDLVSVFILPPSMHELERRLNTRAQDSAETVAFRMEKAIDEVSHWGEYDYIIVNNDLDYSIEQVQAIITAERLKRSRQQGLADFIKHLRQGG